MARCRFETRTQATHPRRVGAHHEQQAGGTPHKAPTDETKAREGGEVSVEAERVPEAYEVVGKVMRAHGTGM
jgi:hypothetical protein